MPAWFMCPRGNMPNKCQLLIFTCQRVKGLPFIQFGVPTCQRGANFLTIVQKNFWIFQLCSTFASFKNIWAILETLSRKAKNLDFDICQVSLRKNLVNLKPLTSFSLEHVGLTEQLFGYCKMEINIYFIYLTLYTVYKQAYLEKHTSCIP